ncbi:C40 family peptidase [Arthrobacter agilis]|uniref:C40 family peptidase n=1 Tax=Arthrobacter agilis TaxID=37921 RepID=UPI002787EBF9|nr:C40 family peptidase [Arthrobacter agilis]MDQ0735222.1 cell wall-associated NlpC family hydrolase [Arthrobacter agilis]
MSKSHIARHRAVPTRINPLVTASRAVSASASVAGKPAAVVVAASGLLFGAALPASAAGEIAIDTPQQAAVSTAAAGTYTVQAGDTLGSIASSHGVSLETVFAANGLGYSSVIYPGQAISLSGSAAPQQYAPQAVPASSPAVTSTFTSAGNSTGLSTQSAASIAPVSSGSLAGIAGTAMQGKGSSYVYGGTSFGAWDCSGFVQWVYAQQGISLPRTTWAQFAAMTPTSNPQPGDLVSQNGGSHVGIYLGNGQMISALNPSQGTQVHSVNAMAVDGYYTR